MFVNLQSGTSYPNIRYPNSLKKKNSQICCNITECMLQTEPLAILFKNPFNFMLILLKGNHITDIF